jgi:AraC family transcriptional regulator
MSALNTPILNYREMKAADALLPQPSVLSSRGWNQLHLEVFQQPKFEIAEHQHTMHVLAYSSDHSAEPSNGDRWLDGKRGREIRYPGDIAVIPMGVAHRCNWSTAVEFTILAIEPDLLQQVGQDGVEGDRIELIPQFMNCQDGLIQSIFTTLKEELVSSQWGSDLLIDSLKTMLAVHLLRHYCTLQPKLIKRSHGLSKAILRQVTSYINENLHQNLKVVELSAIAQLTPYHFLRQFKQTLGITPHQYILHKRIETAKQLLQQQELSIAEISVRTGFSDQSHLTRCFKRRVGVTPKQFSQS